MFCIKELYRQVLSVGLNLAFHVRKSQGLYVKNNKKFLKIITYAPLIFIPIFVFLIIISSYEVYSVSFESSIKNLETNFLYNEKKALETKVNNISNLIVFQRSRIKKELLNRVKERVYMAHEIASNIYDEYKQTKTKKDIKDIIITSLKTLSWNKGESYIWAMNSSGVHYLLEDKKMMQGKSFRNFQDANGRYIVQEENAICKDKKEGYLWDTFTKPEKNYNAQYKQVAFVKAFKPYNWCLGSAEFLDTATKKTDKFLFNLISQIDKLKHHYVVILNSKGKLLVDNKLPQFVGKNANITDKLVVKTISDFLNNIKGKETSTYVYDWQNLVTNKIEKKYAYLKRIPNTNWIITSGIFLSEIENEIEKQKVSMIGMYNSKTKYMFLFAVTILLISLLISFLLSRKIKKYFTEYENSLENKSIELEELNISLEEKIQARTSELVKLKDNFEKLATTDNLTQLHNRYSIMNILEQEMKRLKRHDAPLSILMYDIDHFKSVNDTYGHDRGDKVLSLLSKLVRDSIRDIDYIGRYGGEEFLIVMPNTSLHNAAIYAERLRQAVQEYSFEELGKLTISIGIAELGNDSIKSFFKRVDDLLYLSKTKGRNRVSY